MLSFLISAMSNFSLANAFKEYAYLSENSVESNTYEIKKLIDGIIQGVLYAPDSDMIIVVSDDYLWKINQDGYVFDTLKRPSGMFMYSSGIYYDDTHYIDWAYSGIKQKQPYSEIIDAKEMSQAELTAYLDDADIVEFRKFYKNATANLKIKEKVIVLDITHLYDKISNRCSGYGADKFEKLAWSVTCLEGYERKKPVSLYFLENSRSTYSFRDWDDKSHWINIQKFVKKHYYREGEVSGQVFRFTLGPYLKAMGLPGESPKSYWFGTGYFQIKHQSEILNFKAFVSNEDEGIKFESLKSYSLPDNKAPDLRIISISYRNDTYNYLEGEQKLNQFYEKELGLYVLREKLYAASTRNNWQLKITGMKLGNSTWGDISYFNNEKSPTHYLWHASAIPNVLTGLPKKITFNWDVNVSENTAFRLRYKEHVSWYYLRRYNANVFIQLTFDEAELINAFRQLEDERIPLTLEVRLDDVTETNTTLSVYLRNDKEDILLENIAIETNSIELNKIKSLGEPGEESTRKAILQFEKSKLNIAFQDAFQDKAAIDDFIRISGKISMESPYVKEYSFHFANYITKLIITSLRRDDPKSAEAIIYHYADSILPYSGKHKKISDVASNSLVYAVVYHRNDVVSLVFKKLLGPEYDISTEKNEILLFNLSGYYATHNDKELMLEAIAYALKAGKNPEQFMNDSDFKEYWGDAEFKAVLGVQ